MPAESAEPAADRVAPDGAALLARARRATVREQRRLDAAIHDLFLTEDDRLDDRTRAEITATIAATVDSVERDLASQVSRAIAGPIPSGTLDRLLASGLLRDPALISELVEAARLALIAAMLEDRVARQDQSNLARRLLDSSDAAIAGAAQAMLAVEPEYADLPPALRHRLVWWVAAAMREARPDDADFDRALDAAATRIVAGHGDAGGPGAAARRLAAAMNARPEEVGAVLIEALCDARPALFVALLARAARMDFGDTRRIVVDPDGDRLWLALRVIPLDRGEIARIGLLLAEADPRRDIEAFADALDTTMAIAPAVADRALAPMRLHPDFRAAILSLARSANR